MYRGIGTPPGMREHGNTMLPYLRAPVSFKRLPSLIYLDTHMLCGVYQERGICVRNHCGAEPPRDIGPPGLVTTVGGRDRASAAYAAADRVQAPASAARGRFRGIHGGRTAPSLPAEARTASGGRCLAGSVPSALVRSRRCSRTPPRPHGSVDTDEKEGEEKTPMNVLLWVLQVALALLYLAGGSYKVFKFDELANHLRALSRGGWRALGLLEMLGAVLLIVPAAANWLPVLTPLAAAALALETLALAGLYARYSLKVAATNPMVWAVVMGLLATFVAYGRYALKPLG